jgi:hypothetical protein
MKNGKIRHYRSKNAYERSLKAMFANQNTNHSVKRKIAKSKTSKRIKHKGVGKVSSVKKKFCDTCKREGQSFEEGKCKICVEAFKEYKQPQATPEQILQKNIDRIGNRINFNWINYVEEEWDSIRSLLDTIPPDTDTHEAIAYMFVKINKDTQDIVSVEVDLHPDQWEQRNLHDETHWVADILVSHHTTRQQLRNINVADEAYFWTDFENEQGTVDGGFVV